MFNQQSYQKSKIFLIIIFSIAMGMLEAIVVIYLREIANIGDELFPLKQILPKIFFPEILREITTIVMLVSISIIAGKNSIERFAFFLLSFGVWDIFYYIWLKILIDWPQSFFTWDVLFLIPTVWIGPVLAPIICSITMILLSSVIFYNIKSNTSFKIKLVGWIIIITGAVLILFTFLYDYGSLVIEHGIGEELNNLIAVYSPTHFNWVLFIIGELIILFLIYYLRAINSSDIKKH